MRALGAKGRRPPVRGAVPEIAPEGLRVHVEGIPRDLPVDLAAALRGRLDRSAREIFAETQLSELNLMIRRGGLPAGDAGPESTDHAESASAPTGPTPRTRERSSDMSSDGYFRPINPLHSFSSVVLPDSTRSVLRSCIDLVRFTPKIFGQWGLADIEPHPRSAINLHGAPGTGKTLIAHAIASELARPIIQARTSQLESKYHGEGGKYLDELFCAARRWAAVLFIDEAESLLSRRFESVSQGSEHAINLLRSELIQHLDNFEGVAVFATNLVSSYDPAIQSRLISIAIPIPNVDARKLIWKRHLPDALPLAPNVSIDELAAVENIVGRDIKQAVIIAAVAAAGRGSECVTQTDLMNSLKLILDQEGRAGARLISVDDLKDANEVDLTGR